MSEILKKLAEYLVAGKLDEVVTLTEEALDGGADPSDVLDNGLLSGMGVVGELFASGQLFVPEVLLRAKCMHGALAILRPLLIETGVQSIGTLVIGTVQGDIHDIGKRLVGMMMEGAGFDVVDLGVNNKPEVFVDAIKEHNAELVGMSALLTTTIPGMERTIDAIEEAGIRDQVKIMVGGAPVSEAFAEKIGADGYGESATHAVQLAKELIGC